MDRQLQGIFLGPSFQRGLENKQLRRAGRSLIALPDEHLRSIQKSKTYKERIHDYMEEPIYDS